MDSEFQKNATKNLANIKSNLTELVTPLKSFMEKHASDMTPEQAEQYKSALENPVFKEAAEKILDSNKKKRE